MSTYGGVEAVLQALQRQGREAGLVRAVPFYERLPAAPSGPEPGLHWARQEAESSEVLKGKDSFIKVRYAFDGVASCSNP